MKSINSNQTQLKTLFFGLLCLLAGVVCFAKGYSSPSNSATAAITSGERQAVRPPSAFIRDAGKPEFTSLTPRYVTKRIADLEVGEEVVAKNPESGEVTTKRVANVFRKVSDHLRILQVRNPLTDELQAIETTDDHPFWVAALGQWIDAKDLKLGDRLDDVDGCIAILESTSRELHPEGIPVFNFEVEDFHTYFVRAHGSRGPPLLTHNTECGDGFVSLQSVEQAARDAAARFDAPSGSFGGLSANTVEEATFLRNATAAFGDASVFSSARRFSGSIVIQRSDIPFSVQNVRSMAAGRTPFVRNRLGDWEKLNLHHVGRQDGKLIEVLGSHNRYDNITGAPLHIPGPGGPVRDATFTQNYWRQRLQDAIDTGLVPRDVLRQSGL